MVPTFTKKQIDQISKNTLIDEAIMVKSLEIMIHNGFNDKRKVLSYLSCIESLDNWEVNLLEFLKYSESIKPQAGLYDKTYISLKYNVTIERAEEIINSKKSSKATNLKGFIDRHGVEKGKILYEEFKVKSISCTKETVSEHDRKARSVWCKEYYMKHGQTEAEAIESAKLFNRNNAGANKWYWEGKGYSDEEVKEILSAINAKKDSGVKSYFKKYGNDWKSHWNARIEKLRKTLNSPDDIDDFSNYKKECNIISERNLILYGDMIENLELRGREYGYQVDHIFSIKMGYLYNIEPKIIGHITNLRCITSFLNESKGSKCDKTIDELLRDYNEHESKINQSN